MDTTIAIPEPTLINIARFEVVSNGGHVRENARISAKTIKEIDGAFIVTVSVERLHDEAGVWFTDVNTTIEGLFDEVLNEDGISSDEVVYFVVAMVTKLHEDETGHELPERYFMKHMTMGVL